MRVKGHSLDILIHRGCVIEYTTVNVSNRKHGSKQQKKYGFVISYVYTNDQSTEDYYCWGTIRYFVIGESEYEVCMNVASQWLKIQINIANHNIFLKPLLFTLWDIAMVHVTSMWDNEGTFTCIQYYMMLTTKTYCHMCLECELLLGLTR